MHRMRWSKSLIAGAMLFAGFTQPALADSQGIDEVVVTATRMPVKGSELAASAERVLVEDTLRAFQGLDFTEVLVAVPGLFVQSHYNAAQDLRLDLRGFGARGNFGIRGIRIFVDGMPESLPDGQAQVDTLDPLAVRSVELLRGPAASLYGNAAGGVILIETVPVTESPPWRVSYGLGAHGFERYGASVRLGVPGAGGAARLSLSRQVLEGFRDHAESASLRLSAQLAVTLDGRDRLEIRAQATDAPTALDPGGLNFADFQMDPGKAAANNRVFNAGEVLDQQSLSWRWRRALDETRSLQLSNYFTWRDFENRLPFRGGGAVELGRRLGGAGLQYRWQSGRSMRWVAGLDIDQQEDRRRRFDNEAGDKGELRLDQDEDVLAFGAFVANDVRLSERLALQAALRLDSLRVALGDRFLADGEDSGTRRFTRLSPSVGLLLGASEDQRWYARYSTSFETPTTTELANPAGPGFNPAVGPQTSAAFEIGTRRQAAQGSPMPDLEVAAYQIDVSDELVGYELAAQPGRSFFANAARSRRRGLEVSAVFGRGEALGFRLSGAWTESVFERFEQDGEVFTGNRIPGTPGLRVAGSWSWRPAENWQLGLDAARVWRVFADNANTVRSPDFLDVGLRAAYQMNIGPRRLEIYAGLRNLLDQKFADNLRINAFGGRYFEPAPPRYLYAGLRVGGQD